MNSQIRGYQVETCFGNKGCPNGNHSGDNMVTDKTCTNCNACVTVCKENAIFLDKESEKPRIAFDGCLMCGQCIKACPSNTLMAETSGFRVQLGGRLGRHPRLAMEIPGIHGEEKVLAIVKKSILFFK